MNDRSRKIFKSVIRIMLLVIVAGVIGVNVYLINASRLGGDNVPMPFGVGAAVVLSGSMEPELSTGDLILVAERNSYEVGDVVVYQDGRMAVTHRIVSISDDEIITRGDANNTDDDPIKLEQIKGEVIFAIPFVGHLVNMLKTPIGTLTILVLAVFLLERSFRAEKENDKRKLDAIRAEIERLKDEQNKNT